MSCSCCHHTGLELKQKLAASEGEREALLATVACLKERRVSEQWAAKRDLSVQQAILDIREEKINEELSRINDAHAERFQVRLLMVITAYIAERVFGARNSGKKTDC